MSFERYDNRKPKSSRFNGYGHPSSRHSISREDSRSHKSRFSKPPRRPRSEHSPAHANGNGQEPKPEKGEPDNKHAGLGASDPATGTNPNDSKFDLQMHHMSYLAQLSPTSEVDVTQNFKVIYDPELDKSLSKAEKKGKHRKLHFQSATQPNPPSDPRVKMGLSKYYSKPNKSSKKFPYKQLPRPRYSYDKDSVGSPPPSELVLWDLPASINELYLMNFLESFGNSVKAIKFINDPINAVPLGIATFSFQASAEKAAGLAKDFIKTVRTELPKVDGVELRVALNDSNEYLLQSKIKASQERLRSEHIKREAEERKRIEAKKRKEAEEKKVEEKKPTELSYEDHVKSLLNTTTLSSKHHHRRIEGAEVPLDLAKYVKDRPFIFINDKYVPTRKISSQDIKKVLTKYDWTRVLLDKTGFYVVFKTLKECERCFYNEDGVGFFEYRMYMEMCVPEKFDENASAKSSSGASQNAAVDEAVNSLIRDFQTFLGKDIRERIIAPMIIDLLNPDKYPDLMKELKEKELKEAEESKHRLPIPSPVKNDNYAFMSDRRSAGPKNNHVLTLPSFTKKLGSSAANKKTRKSLFPMQHALNYDDHDSDGSDDDETSRSTTPVPSMKRESPVTPDFEEAPFKKQKKSKLRETFMYDETSDEEGESAGVKLESTEDLPEASESSTEDSAIDSKYQSTLTERAQLVYPETELKATSVRDISWLQDLLKDDEDIELARKVLAGVEPSSVKHPEYWAWKEKQSNAIVSEEESIGVLSEHLECQTGSFKSEGYRKISDADKAEYLPHRKKIHKPLKTVQHDGEENGGAGASNNNAGNTQSSRVNRANNRRFAADISAQKQILSSESDILNLNALNKRKKPVSFARSAIHNWGLYALEPIAAKEMIIEYVGESIRQQVAEHREKSYMRTGIGSSYLFRVDENIVIDATKKGGIARFINHCCSPSCTAKIIKVDGKKRIVIYALKDIEANEELTYDYKFERETNDAERIRCLCGAPGCKGYLN